MLRTAVACLLTVCAANAQTPAPKLWDQLQQKRSALSAFRQEFAVSRTDQSTGGSTGNREWRLTVEWKGAQWREKTNAGWGNYDRLFTAAELLTIDENRGEFQRAKFRPRDKAPLPAPYGLARDLDWSKAEETQRRSCSSSNPGRVCAIVQIPLAEWSEFTPGNTPTQVRQIRHSGSASLVLDTETGLLLEYLAVEAMEENGLIRSYQTHYLAKTTTLNASLPADAFTASLASLKGVKSFSIWDAKFVRKALEGKPMPEIAGVDLNGNPISLSALKGKTVLLDFWASWCPPCRADGPALNKLQEKYGSGSFVILGIDIGEDRATVEDYLRGHPAKYPIMLASQDDLPRPLQTQLIPTYVAVDANGDFIAATSGAQGLDELKKLLKKTGIGLD